MTTEEKIGLIERVLGVEPGSLTEDTGLETVAEWDSLSILNLQVELTALMPDVQFDNLYNCMTVAEICQMI